MNEPDGRESGSSDPSRAALFISAGALVVVGVLCGALKVPDTIAQVVTASAAIIPAAIALTRHRRRRHQSDRGADVGAGQRPIGLLVLLSAAILSVYDLVSGEVIRTLAGQGSVILVLALVASAVPVFVGAAWLSSDLSSRPYLWIAATVGLAFLIRSFVLVVAAPDPFGDDFFGMILAVTFAGYLVHLIAALAGTWFGRRRLRSGTRMAATTDATGRR